MAAVPDALPRRPRLRSRPHHVVGHGAGLVARARVIGVRSPMADRLPTERSPAERGRVVEHQRYPTSGPAPPSPPSPTLDQVVDPSCRDLRDRVLQARLQHQRRRGHRRRADSIGAGLLDHNRAHLAWLDSLLDRHPRPGAENCSSGAMRMDFASSRAPGPVDVRPAGPTCGTRPSPRAPRPCRCCPSRRPTGPYPQPGDGLEEVAFALATGLLGRLYRSGTSTGCRRRNEGLVAEAGRRSGGSAPQARSPCRSGPSACRLDRSLGHLGLRGESSALSPSGTAPVGTRRCSPCRVHRRRTSWSRRSSRGRSRPGLPVGPRRRDVDGAQRPVRVRCAHDPGPTSAGRTRPTGRLPEEVEVAGRDRVSPTSPSRAYTRRAVETTKRSRFLGPVPPSARGGAARRRGRRRARPVIVRCGMSMRWCRRSRRADGAARGRPPGRRPDRHPRSRRRTGRR